MADAKLHRSSSFSEHVNKTIDDMLECARIARSKAVSLEQELKLLRDKLEATVAKEHLVDLSQEEQQSVLDRCQAVAQCLDSVKIEIAILRSPEQTSAFASAKNRVAQLRQALEEASDAAEAVQVTKRISEHRNATEPEAMGALDSRFQSVVLGCCLADQKKIRQDLRNLHARAEEISARLAERGSSSSPSNASGPTSNGRRSSIDTVAPEHMPAKPVPAQRTTPHPARHPAFAPAKPFDTAPTTHRRQRSLAEEAEADADTLTSPAARKTEMGRYPYAHSTQQSRPRHRHTNDPDLYSQQSVRGAEAMPVDEPIPGHHRHTARAPHRAHRARPTDPYTAHGPQGWTERPEVRSAWPADWNQSWADAGFGSPFGGAAGFEDPFVQGRRDVRRDPFGGSLPFGGRPRSRW